LASSVADMATGNFYRAAKGFSKIKSPDLRQVINEKGEMEIKSTGTSSSMAIGTGASSSSSTRLNSSSHQQNQGLTPLIGTNLNAYLIPPADIGLYAVLCGLATMSRTEVKEHLVENNQFRVILDSEAGLRDLVRECGVGTSWGDGLKALGVGSGFEKKNHSSSTQMDVDSSPLQQFKTRLELDIHLAGSNKLETLRNKIREEFVRRLFQPYERIAIKRMSTKFGWDEDEMESVIVGLIKKKAVEGRVDRREKVCQLIRFFKLPIFNKLKSGPRFSFAFGSKASFSTSV
jgi:hypothetical protein